MERITLQYRFKKEDLTKEGIKRLLPHVAERDRIHFFKLWRRALIINKFGRDSTKRQRRRQQLKIISTIKDAIKFIQILNDRQLIGDFSHVASDTTKTETDEILVLFESIKLQIMEEYRKKKENINEEIEIFDSIKKLIKLMKELFRRIELPKRSKREVLQRHRKRIRETNVALQQLETLLVPQNAFERSVSNSSTEREYQEMVDRLSPRPSRKGGSRKSRKHSERRKLQRKTQKRKYTKSKKSSN